MVAAAVRATAVVAQDVCGGGNGVAVGTKLALGAQRPVLRARRAVLAQQLRVVAQQQPFEGFRAGVLERAEVDVVTRLAVNAVLFQVFA